MLFVLCEKGYPKITFQTAFFFEMIHLNSVEVVYVQKNIICTVDRIGQRQLGVCRIRKRKGTEQEDF